MNGLVQTAVSDFSFIELAKVVQAIEVQADLRQIPEAAVSSFYFGKSGIDSLIRKKYKTINDLVDNKVKIKRFICGLPKPPNRVLVLTAASQIRTIDEQISTIKEQIGRGVRLAQHEQELLYIPTPVKELNDDKIPF